MSVRDLIPASLAKLSHDARLLFLTRFTRLFAYGSLSVILVFYLIGLGLTEAQTGILLSLTLIGDVVISLYLTTRADRVGRRRMLIAGALLMVAAGIAFASTNNLIFLIIAGIIGVISPSGNEVGPFLSIEQAALSHVVSPRVRTEVFAWYTLTGSLATAAGSLCGGVLSQSLQKIVAHPVQSYRVIVIFYAFFGLLLALFFTRLSPSAEVASSAAPHTSLLGKFLGLTHSRHVILKLSGLFALDSFAGGFVIQSLVTYWFYTRFDLALGTLGWIFFGTQILSGLSLLLAARLAPRLGLVNTMVFSHLISNLLLIALAFAPTLSVAVTLLLARHLLSQMDLPTRQTFLMLAVEDQEREHAATLTNTTRTVAQSVSPAVTGWIMQTLSLSAPFLLGGGLKIVYDLLLYATIRNIRTR